MPRVVWWLLAFALQSYTKVLGGVNMVCIIGRKLWLVMLVAWHTVSSPPVMRSMRICLWNHNRKKFRDIHFEVICAAWSACGGHLVRNIVIWQHPKTPIDFTSLLWFTWGDLSLKLLKCVWMNVALFDPDTTSLNLTWSNVKLCRIALKHSSVQNAKHWNISFRSDKYKDYEACHTPLKCKLFTVENTKLKQWTEQMNLFSIISIPHMSRRWENEIVT